MASQNDVGSKRQRIKNPLLPLGFLELIAGFISVYISIKLLLSVSGFVSSGSNPAAWLAAIMGIVIILQGAFNIFSGMFKCFSLVVGRNDPKSLAHNYANPDESQLNMHYRDADLSQMLLARQNKTFVEPRCWIEGLYFSLFRKMFFLPLPYRNVIQGCLSAIINTVVVLICWCIINYIVSVGLVAKGNASIVTSLCTIVLGIKLFFIWRAAYTVERNRIASPSNLSFSHLFMNIAFATLVPGAIATLFSFFSLPDSDILKAITTFLTGYDWTYWFLCFSFLPLVAIVPIFFLCYQKSKEYELKTEVSERIVSWQESIHPREIFIGIENVALAKLRYLEVPNRVYSKLEPTLKVQSDGNKGEFSGYTLQETQPAYVKDEQSIIFKIVKFISAFTAVALNLWIIVLMAAFVKNFALNWHGTFQDGLLTSLLNLIFSMLVLWILSKVLKGATVLFFSEIKFSSLLIHFKTEGTFSESKISTGASIYDSNRSENSVIRSSINQWIVASQVISTTFLGTTIAKFDNARYVMEMSADDNKIDAVLNDLKKFVKSRNMVADVAESSESLRTSEHIQKMNEKNLASLKNTDKSKVVYPIYDEESDDLNLKDTEKLSFSLNVDDSALDGESSSLDDVSQDNGDKE